MAASNAAARDKIVYYLGIWRVSDGKQVGQSSAAELVADKDLSSFSMFTRANYDQFITFATRTVAERTKVGARDVVEEKVGKVHCYHTSLGFAVVMVTELEYDKLAGQQILDQTAQAFQLKFNASDRTRKTPGTFDFPEVKKIRVEAVTAEKRGISAVQRELDETKIVLHQTIESILERGEKLDNLVAKSDELSGMSKGFYKQAKQQNSCCLVM